MAKEAVDTRKLKDSVAEYLKKSKFDKAAELLEELAEAEPEDVQHQLRLGDCYRRLGEAVKSILSYDAAARRFVEDGHLIKAIAAVKIILEIDPENQEAQKQREQRNERRLRKGVASPVGRDGAGEAKSDRVAKAVEPIELPDEPEVTAPVPRAATRGAQRGAMVDRIQIELDPDDGAALELVDGPKLAKDGDESNRVSAAREPDPAAERAGERIQDLPDDAILDPEPLSAGSGADVDEADIRDDADELALDAAGSLADLLAPDAEEEIELLSISTDRPVRKEPEAD